MEHKTNGQVEESHQSKMTIAVDYEATEKVVMDQYRENNKLQESWGSFYNWAYFMVGLNMVYSVIGLSKVIEATRSGFITLKLGILYVTIIVLAVIPLMVYTYKLQRNRKSG